MTLSGLDTIRRGNGFPTAYLVRFEDGVDIDEGIDGLRPDFGDTILRAGSTTDIVSIERVAGLPWILAALIGVMAGGTVLHTMLSGTRRQRHDVAVLKALGFDRRQLGTAGVAQALAFSLVVAGLGIPVGLATGNQAWRLATDTLGIDVALRSPLPLLVLVPVVLAVGLVLSWLPTRVATRTEPAAVLRTD
jgi:putative ABC transport system permease protein